MDIEYVIPHEEEAKEIHFEEPKRNITVVDYFDELFTRLEAIESRVVAIEYRLDSLK